MTGARTVATTPLVNSPKLHITIGTAPSSTPNLDQELRLLKAALLYGDEVKMYSMTASMLRMIVQVGEVDRTEQLELLDRVIPCLCGKGEAKRLRAGIQKYKQMSSASRLGSTQQRARVAFEEGLADNWANVKRKAQELAFSAGLTDIERAVKSGVLELHVFRGTDTDEACLDFMAECICVASKSAAKPNRATELSERDESIIREFVGRVSDSVCDNRTQPLFDSGTADLVSALVREGSIAVSDAAVQRGKHAGLVRCLLAQLPLFDQASIDQILDIRRELERPLVRFRSSVLRFSREIGPAAWDPDFPFEAESVFRRDVAPAVLDIEEAVKSNRYLVVLLRRAAGGVRALTVGPVVTVALSKLSSLPDELAASMALLLSIGPVFPVVYDAYKQWQDRQQAIEQNCLFFYYEAGRRLTTPR
jgi:hypothetical protein